MSDFNQKFNELNDTADYTGQFDSADIEKNRYFCILCYIGILVLIPLFAGDKSSRYTKFHTSQGFTLWICGVALGIITSILSVIPGIKIIGVILSVIFGLAQLALMIIGIINTCRGEAKELPVIGKIRILPY